MIYEKTFGVSVFVSSAKKIKLFVSFIVSRRSESENGGWLSCDSFRFFRDMRWVHRSTLCIEVNQLLGSKRFRVDL